MYDLTHSQKEILTSQVFFPDSPICNETIGVSISGELDAALFQNCWDHVVDTNPVLRTRIDTTAGESIQNQNGVPPSLKVLNFSDQPSPEKSADIWMRNQSATILDLSKGTVVSALLQLSENKWIWFIQQHHVAVDAWSMTLIWNKLIELYQCPEQFKTTNSNFQYRDFLKQYRNRILKNKDNAADAHWTARQKSDPLSLYGVKGTRTTTHSIRETIDLCPTTLERIDTLLSQAPYKTFSQSLGYYQFFLSVFIGWLYTVTDQGNITINMPSMNRASNADKQCMGYFIEILPFKLNIATQASFQNIYKLVHQESMRFIKYANTGSCVHNEGIRPNVFFNYIIGSFNEFPGFETSFDWIYPNQTHPHHSLRLHVLDWNPNKAPSIAIDFNTAWFNEEQRTKAVNHFQRALDLYSTEPKKPISNLPLYNQRDVWNISDPSRIEKPIDNKQQVHLAILEYCGQITDKTAIVQGPKSLSYRELRDFSITFAHFLKDRGIKPGDRIVVHHERDWKILPIILGAFLAGAIYVPIDISNPTQRIRRIEKNAQAVLVISKEADFKQFTDQSKCIPMDDSLFSLDIPYPLTPDHFYTANNNETGLAYLLYTSGSTGEPKGVEILHSSLWRYCSSATNILYKGEPLSFPFVTSIGFDITATSLFSTFLTGGTLHVYPENGRSDALCVLDAVKNTEINILNFTPSQLSLTRELDLSKSRISQIVSLGEQLKYSLVKKLKSQFPHDVVIYNGYGPTESTIACCFYRVDTIPGDQEAVPIGTPIGGMQAIVLNENKLPQIQGVTGELYLSGPLLSPGYWKDTERTDRSFIRIDLFPDQVLYKTGDIVRVNKNGVLEYIGRNDNQIKRNGVRLELGEVAEAAVRHNEISSAIAIVKPPQQCCVTRDIASSLTPDNNHLILYYTGDSELDNDILYEHLAQNLPMPGLPDQAVWLSEMPRNINGKTDVSKLPTPESKHFLRTNQYKAPENETQKFWQATWKSVLDLDIVGITDDFFKIGGNSLLAIRLVSEFNTRGYEYTPMDIFKNPTILLLSNLDRTVTSGQPNTTPKTNTPFSQISQHEAEKLKNMLTK